MVIQPKSANFLKKRTNSQSNTIRVVRKKKDKIPGIGSYDPKL